MAGLNDFSAGKQAIDDADKRQDEQDMDESACDVEDAEAQDPEDEKNDDDGPEHGFTPFGLLCWINCSGRWNVP